MTTVRGLIIFPAAEIGVQIVRHPTVRRSREQRGMNLTADAIKPFIAPLGGLLGGLFIFFQCLNQYEQWRKTKLEIKKLTIEVEKSQENRIADSPPALRPQP